MRSKKWKFWEIVSFACSLTMQLSVPALSASQAICNDISFHLFIFLPHFPFVDKNTVSFQTIDQGLLGDLKSSGVWGMSLI